MSNETKGADDIQTNIVLQYFNLFYSIHIVYQEVQINVHEKFIFFACFADVFNLHRLFMSHVLYLEYKLPWVLHNICSNSKNLN